MFVRVGDLVTHVQVSGPAGAPALVLLHSLGTSLHVWDAQVDALARRFRVIRPDLRGHGLTTVTQGPYHMATLARDVLGLLDALSVANAHVAGLSIGGLIAQAMAEIAPRRVKTLILCDTAMVIPPPSNWHERARLVREGGMAAIAEAVMARWVTPGFRDQPAALGLRQMLLRTDPEGYAGAAEAIATADFTAITPKLKLPAHVIVGAQDEATPVASAEALQAALGASLAIIPDAAHIPTIEHPRAVSAEIAAFLLANTESDTYEAGLRVRREVLGEAHVTRALAAATEFDRGFQEFITRSAWGGVWARGDLDRRTRSLITLALLAALGQHEEFRLHLRATRNTGANAEEIAQAMLHVAVYAGVPAANAAIREAKTVFKEMEQNP